MNDIFDIFAPIETLRLRMRTPRPEDATAISEMMTPSVSRWLASWPVPFTACLATERIASARQANSAGGALIFVLEHRQTSVPLGWIGIVRDSCSENKAALGYWLGEAYQGQGYMHEAAPAAVAAAFSLLCLDEIEAAAQPENAASFAVLRACGMQPAGESMVYAAARGRDELCLRYTVRRPPLF